MARFGVNHAGFVIVGMFIACWAGALAYWKLGKVEERWSAGIRPAELAAPDP